LQCVGWACPGFGEIDELGGDRFIDQIDGSGAHFLVAALGARKGQLWLYRNRHRLRIPVRAHLGATINFQAGTVKRAPKLMRNLGLEWLWRIKEEPKLFSRYARDGGALLAIFVTRLVPLAVAMRWLRWRERTNVGHFEISHSENDRSVTFTIYGYATARQAPAAIEYFARLLNGKRQFIVDLTNTHAIDARFFGLLLMLRKQLQNRGCGLTITGASGALKNSFKQNGVGQLLTISAANQH
jgi:N-acetylglucosaminyldiphosphoundecaprenol N-acetyl-beta-D-mannosaminyltransferase